MIGKVVTGCVAILPYHTATQDRGSECRDFGFISRIVTALELIQLNVQSNIPFCKPVWFIYGIENVKCSKLIDECIACSGFNQLSEIRDVLYLLKP